MTLLADIASGETDWADILFLVGFILFLIAAFLLYPLPQSNRPAVGHTALSLGLAAVALGWLVL